MPTGSTVVVKYDGNDITDHVLFSETSFECQMAAIPGSFSVTVRDVARDQSFVTGKELTLTVDGTLMYGGYVLAAQKQYAFDADKTNPLSSVKSRQWLLTGVDYNILFDKRVLHNASDYTHDIPNVTGSPTDGDVIRDHFSDYFDISGFDFSTFVSDNHTFSTTGHYAWDTQGTKMRDVMEDLAQYGSIYYIDANKKLHFVPIQEDLAGWGLSDKPNNHAFSAGDATRGFREGSMIEDASSIVNDALVWGGSQWAAGGDIVFSRRENSTSETNHGRWQLAENHVGDSNYKISSEVVARAKVIVDGNESGTFAEGSKGLVNPEKQFRCTWFAHDVPTNAGVRQHFLPGQVVPIELWAFTQDGGSTPFSMSVPLRQARFTFPNLQASTGNSWVQIEGFFGVLMSDPYWLWAFLRSAGGSAVPSKKASASVINSTNNDSVSPPYGSMFSDSASPDPDDTTTVFTIPFAYIGSTLRVIDVASGSSREWVRDVDFTESDPTTGTFTATVAPATGHVLWIYAVLAGGDIYVPSGGFPPDGELVFQARPSIGTLPGYLAITTPPIWGTQKVRVSNTADVLPYYSRYCSWNSDGSLILLGFGSPGRMINGNTYADIGSFSQVSNFVWSTVNPNLLWGVDGGGSSHLYRQDATTASITSGDGGTQHTFTGYHVWIGGDSGSWEGGISDGDQYICLTLEDVGAGGGDLLVVYDTVGDSIVGSMAKPASMDNAQISRLGNYVVVVGNGETRVWPRALTGSGTQLWPSDNHGDNALDASGNEIFVTNNRVTAGPVGRGVASYKLSDGTITTLLPAGTAFEYGHTGGHHSRDGWIYLSSYDTVATAGRLGFDQLIAVKTDGSGTVEVFGFANHGSVSDYKAQPHMSPSPGGERVIYGSDNGNGSVYAYIAGATV